MADPSPLSLIVRWPAKVAEEILLAPWTVQQVRTSLTELPERLDVLTATLGDTIGALEKLLPELSTLVSGMDDRVERVELMVNDLGEALLNLMGSIPGVRRAVRDVRPTAR